VLNVIRNDVVMLLLMELLLEPIPHLASQHSLEVVLLLVVLDVSGLLAFKLKS
jgi:hypothetical protein